MTTTTSTAGTHIREITVPELGDFDDVPVIEIHVAQGDAVAADDPLVTLESAKATMDIPAPSAGTVQQLNVALGDRVRVGTLLMSLTAVEDGDEKPGTGDAMVGAEAQAADIAQQESPPETVTEVVAAAEAAATDVTPPGEPGTEKGEPHAGPGVRRLARELQVDLTTVPGTGPKGRITKEDLRAAISGATATDDGGTVPTGMGIPEIPPQDFSVYGPVQTQPLPRITKLSGPFLHRSWLNVPHVTQNDEADITDLEAYRKELDGLAKAQGNRVTLLAFLLKASAAALREFPQVNTSLSEDKSTLIYKSYYHIGVAVDTAMGLVVPVIRDVDRKGVNDLSRELAEVSTRARDGKLTGPDMLGGSFTISSLGGIGGTSFTPIVNAPEVAILGVSRAKMAPVWNGKKFKPRLMLPLSLSYDHRVVDGALAARFARHLCYLLEDVRRLML